uniref:Uncharacterized protein n=1 Tax=Nelumbo nucifera TaxID=4432 RepID=A0A822XHM2_NELNU|nr:TPA_asm: hypothetical protein HUJ06_021200 [Nelumbo nucifera]
MESGNNGNLSNFIKGKVNCIDDHLKRSTTKEKLKNPLTKLNKERRKKMEKQIKEWRLVLILSFLFVFIYRKTSRYCQVAGKF